MRKYLLLSVLLFLSHFLKAQKIDSLFFNLYTDSLKKGSWNYINVDAKLSNGNYMPLTNQHLNFKVSAGKLEGNSIWLDWDFKPQFITVDIELKKNPSVKKSITIWVKKNDEQLNAPVQDSLLQKINKRTKSGSTKKKRGL
ncbi:MAG: hypothetical protein QM725_03570 [Lacibacter sp.]